ncbi:hypothetical protein [uncultured phage cr56_1]|uniref:Uncharacterized protein n=1 Tax=uncultured phage cr56_1 TaxID=2772081 RepID=A0A7M1RSH5_9CAUD|nr:hypothetical protein KNV48_gp65 [uncultured phage cr56_1]QOR56871.1 hypothetical protein [uncultured phage cr56_1]
MIQHVNTVLIGKTLPSAYTTADALTAGAVALFDQNRAIIKTAADAAKATSLYIGVAQNKVKVTMPDGSVADKANIKFGNEIQKNSNPSAVIGGYVAPVLDKIVITLTNATIIAGHRYVLRIVYKDMYEAPGQFTHTYEVFAANTTAADLAAAIVKKINKHANRRVNASASAAVITLTAMEKDDNNGVYSLNEYSVVDMEASLYVTIPGAILSNQPDAIPGAKIVKTPGNPGKGYWKQVRDAEVRYMGYQGHVFTGAYPEVVQDRMVEQGATYDYITVENDNKYLSNDNQYIKTTPLTTELYVKHSTDFASSIVAKGIENFIAA